MPKTATLLLFLCATLFAQQKDSFTDTRDGKTYKTVKIGEQVWMKDNLNYKTDSSWCYGNKDFNCDKYGRLYKWATAREVCPSGWHLPKRAEWLDLFKVIEGEKNYGTYCASDYTVTLGYNGSITLTKAQCEKMKREEFAGKKLKSKTEWNGTDDYEFSALPGGMRYFSGGSFRSLGYFGYYWSDHKFNSKLAYFWTMRSGRDEVEDGIDYKTNGFSVRCLQDNGENAK